MEKAQAINKSGLVKVVSGEGTLDDIGGLENAKQELINYVDLFDPLVGSYGASFPKGVLNIGVPGSGKSLFSRVAGNVLGLPILKVSMGSLMGGIVGESEKNIRTLKSLSNAMAPVVIELDEIDKGVGSAMGGVSTDSGTTERVTQELLTWMGEEHEGVFFIATANDPEKMRHSGGALIRSGRFDKLFFFDFPHAEERRAIFRIHINKRSRLSCPNSPVKSAEDFDLDSLVQLSKGYTGAEIETAVRAAFSSVRGWAGRDNILPQMLLEEKLMEVNPISASQKDGIAAIRGWASQFCCPASTPDPDLARKKTEKTRERAISLG